MHKKNNRGKIKMSVVYLNEHTEAMMYREMYLTMARAARDAEEMHRKADQILIEAMQKCEEMYISADDNKDGQ